MLNERALLGLLEEKRKIFVEIEKITEPMLYVQVEVLEECMKNRESLLAEVREIDQKIDYRIDGQEAMKQALKHNCERQQLSAGLAALYDASLQVKAVVNRIIQNESGIRLHLEAEKDRIRGELEKMSQSSSSVASQYYSTVQRATSHEIEKKL